MHYIQWSNSMAQHILKQLTNDFLSAFKKLFKFQGQFVQEL